MTAWSPALPLPRVRGRALSLDEWVALDEDAEGEVVNGFWEEEEMPDAAHELAVSWLVALLRAWLGARGFVFGSEIKLRVHERTGRKPDVSMYLPGRPAPPRRGALREPPDVVVEVVTPTPRDERRDRVEKMSDYARFGVRWYWLVDPALGSVEIFTLESDGHYKRVEALTEGALDDVPGCPGLRLDVDALWAELARLGDEER